MLLTGLCVLGLLLPWVSALGVSLPPTLAWAIDLAAHWQWFYLIGLIVTLSVLAFADRRWALGVLLVPMPWLGGLPDAAGGVASGASFVVAGANVHLDSTDPRPLLDWVSARRPDVLVVLEVSDAYARAWSLGEQYPHSVVVPRADPFGIALLSRHPIRQQTVIEDEHDTPRIEVVLDWQGQEIAVVAFHPMPPISVADHQRRNDSLAGVVQRFADMPTVIVGDFNATPWSSAFVVPERQGFARATTLLPTWPAAWGGVVGLPIDQVIVSRHWAVAERAVGPDIGSDRFPVVVSLSRREK